MKHFLDFSLTESRHVRFEHPFKQLLALLCMVSIAHCVFAQKTGGTLRIPLRENPGSASMLEESSIVTQFPFMGVFNNLVIFDQTDRVARPESIKPDLATKWSWSDDNKVLTMRLREGVKWHDGKPFTSADVQCTWDMILEKRNAGWRKNPRKEWYHNLRDVTVNGPGEVRFTLARPQPSFMTLLASGYSAVYPCHVDGKLMRQTPIGTGPFKVVEFRPNESVKLVRNADYWKPGLPYLDAIDYKIVQSQATRALSFVAGQFDMTMPDEVGAPMLKDINAQVPKAVCEVAPNNVANALFINHKSPLMQDPRVRRAISLALDRNAFIMATGGTGLLGGNMMPPPYGVWGLTAEQLQSAPGFGKDLEKSRAEARKLMQEAGYGPNKKLKLTYITRQTLPVYIRNATLVADQLRSIYIEGDIEQKEYTIFVGAMIKGAYTLAFGQAGSAADDPDVVLYENYLCNSGRNYTKFCNPEVEAKIHEQSATVDPNKRKQLVQQIDLMLQQDVVRPTLYQGMGGTCWHPYVKGYLKGSNGIYNHNRLENVWLDK
jgi:peptide/nickel transport system substrate-binding protein